jgi:predicted SnoaL-like aldol condensation-catalyzing enzyme
MNNSLRQVNNSELKTYEAFTFETFRIKDGKFTEHWDGVQLAPGWRTELEKPAAK